MLCPMSIFEQFFWNEKLGGGQTNFTKQTTKKIPKIDRCGYITDLPSFKNVACLSVQKVVHIGDLMRILLNFIASKRIESYRKYNVGKIISIVVDGKMV